MTVIAFDGETVAADGRAMLYDEYITADDLVKVSIIRDCIVACAGDLVDCDTFRGWFKQRARYTMDDYPEKLMDSFAALVVTEVGKAYRFEAKGRHDRYLKTPIAIGSGFVSALAAMKAGADARRAVEIACELTASCGGLITTVSVSDLTRQLQEKQTREEQGLPLTPSLDALARE